MLKDQKDCRHEKLTFGSGDFYVFCVDCGRSWVHRKMEDDTISYEHGQNVTGEYRVAFPDNLTFIELKAKEKGLDNDRETIQGKDKEQ